MSDFNRATAETALAHARQQIFEPARQKFDLTLKTLFQESRQSMSWKITMNRRVRDLLVHMYCEPEKRKATVMLSRKGQGAGWIIFVPHNDVNGEPIMSFDCLQRGDLDALLAGWQWARSERAISRQTYKEGREWLCSLFARRAIGKRRNRHALTGASAKVIGSIMKEPKK